MPYQNTWNTWANPYASASSFGYQNLPTSVQPTSYQLPTNGVVKVNGRDSAMQYQLPPNSMSPALFDNNGKVFYIVSTDGTGMKTVEAFDFTPHKDEQPVKIDGAEFVSRTEYDQFVAKVNAALEAINGVHAAVPATNTADGAKGADGTAQVYDARGLVRTDS